MFEIQPKDAIDDNQPKDRYSAEFQMELFHFRSAKKMAFYKPRT